MIPKASELFDLDHCPVPGLIAPDEAPWLALTRIGEAITALVNSRPGFYTQIQPGVYIGPGTVVAPTAGLVGPAVFGANCEIRHSAFIRNNVIVGDGVVIGNSTELKNCLLFNEVQVPHFNYVGDSILGHKAHLGAGVILSNVRLDSAPVVVKDSEPGSDGASLSRDTGLLKFGALIGDRAEIGSNCVLNPGTIVGRRAIIYPLTPVWGIVPEDAVLKGRRSHPHRS